MAHEIVASADATTGARGERFLARGARVALRLWDHKPAGEVAPEHSNAYEYVAYVVSGRLRVRVGGGEPAEVGPGDSWVVPERTPYSFEVLAAATVVEAVSPPDAL